VAYDILHTSFPAWVNAQQDDATEIHEASGRERAVRNQVHVDMQFEDTNVPDSPAVEERGLEKAVSLVKIGSYQSYGAWVDELGECSAHLREVWSDRASERAHR
jgi:hypothetical protein